MSELEKVTRRLRRSTWDNRVVASRHDVARLFNALEDALESYDEPMSCLTAAERGEILAGEIRELLREGGGA